jgi:hypothetical protein
MDDLLRRRKWAKGPLRQALKRQRATGSGSIAGTAARPFRWVPFSSAR